MGVKHNKSRLAPEFVSLFNGAEKPELMELRQRQFAASWAAINARIQVRVRPCQPPLATPTVRDVGLVQSGKCLVHVVRQC